MPDPVVNPQQAQSRQSLPAIDRKAATERLVLEAVNFPATAIAAERIDLLRSDILGPLSQQQSKQQFEESKNIVVKELSKRLDNQSSSPGPDTPAAKSWQWLSEHNTLKRLAPQQASRLEPVANEHCELLLKNINSELLKARLDDSSSNLEAIDQALRKTKVLLALAPSEQAPSVETYLNSLVKEATSIGAGEIRVHLDELISAAKEFHQKSSTISKSQLVSVLSAAKSSPELADPLWNKLAPLLETEGQQVLFKTSSGETWQLGALGRPNLQSAARCQLVFSCPEQNHAVFACTAESLSNLLAHGTSGKDSLEKRLEQAIVDRTQELDSDSRKSLASTTIDRQHCAFIAVAPEKLDPTTTNAMLGSALLARALTAGQNVESRRALLITESPIQSLTSELKSMLSEHPDLKDVVVDFNQHGSKSGLLFEQSVGAESLTALAEEFPNLKFHFNTLACNGGGLVDNLMLALKQQPELASRISLYTQVKPEMLNILSPSGTFGQRPSMMDFNSPTQQLLFIRSLMSHPGQIGRAFLESDEQGKSIAPLDSEAVINGNKLSSHTVGASLPKV